MKTIADLTINQLNSLAHIAMLRLDRRAIFMADSPKDVFKDALKDTLTPYEMRILLKLLPDLNAGRTPVITDNDEPGLMLVKATWCGIRAYGLDRFFSAGTLAGFGTFKNRYLVESVVVQQSLSMAAERAAIDFYVERIENLHAAGFESLKLVDNEWLKPTSHGIADYWNNVAAARHLGKDPVKWAKHVEKNKGVVNA